MQIQGNTILITGGGSGIGLGLAQAFHKLGNEVIIAGRSEKTLDTAITANPGLKGMTLDIEDEAAVQSFSDRLTKDYPNLNVLINNAGVMRPENLLKQPAGVPDATAMVTTNLLGPIRLTAALLPHLLERPKPVVMNNSSGLAFVPLAMTPTYCATKAALHSYTESLRYQLRESPIQVLELVPPYVQTTLMGDHQATDSRAMPLDAFISEVMDILKNQPEATEICVHNVDMLRDAANGGRQKYQELFKGFNDSMMAAAASAN